MVGSSPGQGIAIIAQCVPAGFPTEQAGTLDPAYRALGWDPVEREGPGPSTTPFHSLGQHPGQERLSPGLGLRYRVCPDRGAGHYSETAGTIYALIEGLGLYIGTV